MKGKVYIRTFGCQMNEKDSERMLGMLADAGYSEAARAEDADVIVVNTCSVREKPEQKVLGLLGQWQRLKRERPETVIAVTGCFAQQRGEALLARSGHLDLVVGTHQLHRLPELVERARAGERRAAVEWLPAGAGELFALPAAYGRGAVTAFVTIMQGCDNGCAYCIVPSVRGRSEHRPAQEILSEIEGLAARGVREVTLLGQNVNAYRDREDDFPQLLTRAADAPGIARVRFTTSHPKDLDERTIAAMAKRPGIVEHVHLPVQSGSDPVLRQMRRGYTRGHYLELIARLREAMPGVGLTTDLIVGFPGETEKDFEDTLSLLDEVRYDETFSFRFSARPGTPAADFGGLVPEYEKYDRLYRLQKLQREITEAKNREMVGREVEVLVEGPSKTDPARMSGRSRENRLVHFARGGVKAGELVSVRITEALKHSLVGEMMGSGSEGPSRDFGSGEETCLSR